MADREDELGRLTGVLNSTFAQLESAFVPQRQFTADAAHELRTPLAVMITEAQTTLSRERTAAKYRETVEVCLDAAQRMRRLTGLLLQLARLEAGSDESPRANVDLAEVARDCVERLRPLVGQRAVRIHCDLQPAPVFSGEDRLSQVVTNLLTNAVRYNKTGGQVRLKTFTDGSNAVLCRHGSRNRGRRSPPHLRSFLLRGQSPLESGRSQRPGAEDL